MPSVGSLQARPAPGTPPAILLVDDNSGKRMTLRTMLDPLGHRVVEADSGRAALRAVLNETFALILMDVRMPTLDGYATAKLIRERPASALTPIIFVTAFGRDEVETATAYASGGVDFVFAPVLPDVLRAKVSVFVDLFVAAQQVKSALESITRLNAALRDSEMRTNAILDNVSDAIVMVDERGRIVSANRAVTQIFGHAVEETIGESFTLMVAPEHDGHFHALEAAGRVSPVDLLIPGRGTDMNGRHRDGTIFPVEVECRRMAHGDATFTLAVVRDVSERRAHTAALEHQALHDGLTGLANRRLFGQQILQALAAAKRGGEPRSVLVLDLDGFKHVNDTLGHDHGDALLKEVGMRLRAVLRESDVVARLGGDEFAVLPEGSCDLVSAEAVAWKIQQACEPPFLLGDEPVQIAASVGIALYPEHGDNAADLLRRADLAMYEAKRSSSAHAVFDPAHEKRLARHLALLGDLRHCLAREELEVHYQPKIHLATREVSGVEALVRWRHPTLGLLPPGGFIPEAERLEMIGPLTRWVLDETLRQQRAWGDEGLDLTVAVNIAAGSLREGSDLPASVGELLAKWDAEPERLILELTEGALIETGAPDALDALHAMGVKLSIDDFGTGYSSLTYLQRLPVDELKIDRSFVTNLHTGSDEAMIVRSTIDLAHNLGFDVVAEGVEDGAVLELLAGYGCDSVQGYFISRPSPAVDFVSWLADSGYAPTSALPAPKPPRGGQHHSPVAA